MRIIRAPSLGTAHDLVVKMVLEKGWVLNTEDREATIEFDEIAMRIEHPDTEPMVSPHSRFSRKFVEQYAHDLLFGTSAVFEYDYHDRLYNWEHPWRQRELYFISTRLPISSANLHHPR